jgi:transmembrane sensor
MDAVASAWIARRDAGMTAVEVEEFTRWVAVPEHAQAFARHEQTWSFFDRSGPASHGSGLVQQVRFRVARRRYRKIIATSAGAVVLAVVGVFWRQSLLNFGAIAGASARTAVVLLPETLTLPDGSKAELKPGADLAVEFTSQIRRVYLRKGEAHFQVTKDSERPFVVTVARVEVRAVGTAFSVELDRAAVAVLVTEGRVSVDQLPRSDAVPAPSRPRILGEVDAGNSFVVELTPASSAPLPAVVPMSGREISERLAWRAPRLEFTGARLADAVMLMNRFSQVRLVIDDPVLNELEISGYFRADNTVMFLHLLEQGLGVKSEPRGDVIGLRKAKQP